MSEQKAILAAGCFWGVEELLRAMPGVIRTEVGYCGGTSAEDAVYTKVKTGQTNHAEAVLIHFDSDVLTYKDLLRAFFKLHDPTTLNQQGNDVGTQYRSAIFYFDENQKTAALEIKKEVQESGKWMKPLVTQIQEAAPFYTAEEYHQDYLQKNPNGYTCHYWRE
ncbi:MAG: peptide-methionine (S)-S-oxide reductase [Bdellovibrionales bacterium RIFCSPHIGHO2_01_FULL_40_29]|nr:MAG: peptide-methionine (S)-S-oxide reductase [Bdellovibrionales bacterium RIFCSPHIGHO2_01_FULL_40_29]OFZ35380.1 MAG: peptide-methionine (S)-S-oxide reductase [Bdellovibrionales bacterium RIFCSPHIGHO2_02_FULL_40_15]